MNSGIFADNYRLRLLRLLKCCVREIVCLDIKRKFLLTECDEWKKVSYKTKTTRYKNAAGVVVNYKNTSAFIVSRNQKVKVKNYDDIKLQIDIVYNFLFVVNIYKFFFYQTFDNCRTQTLNIHSVTRRKVNKIAKQLRGAIGISAANYRFTLRA